MLCRKNRKQTFLHHPLYNPPTEPSRGVCLGGGCGGLRGELPSVRFSRWAMQLGKICDVALPVARGVRLGRRARRKTRRRWEAFEGCRHVQMGVLPHRCHQLGRLLYGTQLRTHHPAPTRLTLRATPNRQQNQKQGYFAHPLHRYKVTQKKSNLKQSGRHSAVSDQFFDMLATLAVLTPGALRTLRTLGVHTKCRIKSVSCLDFRAS